MDNHFIIRAEYNRGLLKNNLSPISGFRRKVIRTRKGGEEMKYKLLVPALAFAVTGTAVMVNSAPAQAAETGQYPELVQKLVQRFNLKESDVQVVFDEYKKERHGQMTARLEERLAELVKTGKLSEAQKQAILAKKAEWDTQVHNTDWKSLSPEERRAKKQAHFEEMKKWAEENGIEFKFFMGMGKMGGMKRGW